MIGDAELSSWLSSPDEAFVGMVVVKRMATEIRRLRRALREAETIAAENAELAWMYRGLDK